MHYTISYKIRQNPKTRQDKTRPKTGPKTRPKTRPRQIEDKTKKGGKTTRGERENKTRLD